MLDSSVFKRLSKNDSGESRGHQAGIVIPRDLAEFFPPLPVSASSEIPTVDARLNVDLYVDGLRVGSVQARYQHQTWGGTRSPERRLTDNLGPLRNASVRGDIVLFTKDSLDDTYLQVHLIRQGTEDFERLNARLPTKNWGLVDPKNRPVSITEIKEAEIYIAEQAQGIPTAFVADRSSVETISVRKARDRAFRMSVLAQYGSSCAFTDRRFVSPVSPRTIGLDAAHVIPVQHNGSDHPANGFPLTKELHWAFDKGLVGVNTDRTILVPRNVGKMAGNEFLLSLHGRPIREAINPHFRVLEEAFAWHRANVLLQ